MATCFNKSLPEYRDLMAVYNDATIVDGIITAFQKKNSTEAYPTVLEAAAVRRSGSLQYSLNRMKVMDAVYVNIAAKGFLIKKGNDYYIKGASEATRATNVNSIRTLLQLNGISRAALRIYKDSKGFKAVIDPALLQDQVRSSKKASNIFAVTTLLENRFPNVELKFVSEEEAEKIYNGLPKEHKRNVPFENVKSFYYKGVSYLINNRVTTETAIEEMVHPLIDAVKKDNPGLFNSLLQEAKANFPALNQAIRATYSEESDFTDEDRDVELVAQSLSRHFNKQYELVGGITRSYQNRLADLFKWFANALKDLLNTFAGTDLQVTVKDISSAVTLSDIADMLMTDNIQFVFETQNDVVRYSIQEDLAPNIKKLLRNANPIQKQIIMDIVLNDGMDIKLVKENEKGEEVHYYTAQKGEYEGKDMDSVTYSIKGEWNDERKTEEFSRTFGNQFDQILEDIAAQNRKEDAIANAKAVAEKEGVQGLTEEQLDDVYETLRAYSLGLMGDGTILVPQVIVGDPNAGIAGSIDLLAISATGEIRIYDLKVTKYAYGTKAFPVSTGSRLSPDTQLSTREQHSIQVNVYKRIIENMGYKVQGTYTINAVYTPVMENNQVVGFKSYELNPVYSHTEFAQSTHVDTLVPVTHDGMFKNELNATKSREFVSEESEEPKLEENPLNQPETFMNAYNVLQEFMTKLYTRKELLETLLNQSRSSTAKKKAVNALSVVLSQAETNLKGADPSNNRLRLAIGTVLKYVEKDINNIISYLADPENVKDEKYPTILINYKTFVLSYKSLDKLRNILSQQDPLAKRLQSVIVGINSIEQDIALGFKEFAKYQALQNSSRREDFINDPEELDKLVSEAEDISEFRKQTQSPTASADTLSVVADRIFKRKIQQIRNKTKNVEERASIIGSRLIEISKKYGISPSEAYDFMLDTDSDGEFNGRYVTKVSKNFRIMYAKIKEKLLDEEGNMRQYIPLKNITDDPKKAKENQELYELKNEYRQFLRAERTVDGKVEDGEYHQYTPEFKAIRERYERFTGYQWVRRNDVSDIDYENYKIKYYDKVSYLKPVTVKGVFSGIVEEATGYFVKREHVQVKDVSDKGEKLVDDRYEKIMTDQSELGKARKEFYDFYIQEYEQYALQQLPRDIRNSMLGKIGRVQREFIGRVIDSPGKVAEATMKNVVPGVKNLFQTDYHAKVSYTDENGAPIETAPIMFVQDLQNRKNVERLEGLLETLKNDFKAKTINVKEYTEEKDRLSKLLSIERNKLTPDKIEKDLTKNLIKFRQMSENYEGLMEIQDTLLAIGEVIENRTYVPKGGKFNKVVKTLKGESVKEVQTVEGSKSKTAERYKMWMKMAFYNEKAFSQTPVEKVTKKIMGYTSLTFIGFNPFSAINNLLYGNISNRIEAAGGQFFNREAYNSAAAEFYSKALPGHLAAMGTAKGYYGKKRDGSLYSALVNKFNVVRKYQSGEGRASVPEIFDFAYALSEGGEYEIQSKVGIAILKSTMIKDENGQNEISVYDAFVYNPNTGELSMKDGYSLTEEQTADITLKIYRVNEYIHGNYAEEDRMVLQNGFVGQLAAQFHKWVIPGLDARFRTQYYDEYLGDVEGRYRTFGRFMNYLYQTTGDIEATKEAFTETQLKNIYKVLAEIGFFVASFAAYMIFRNLRDGLDDDDDGKFAKRMLGAMQYQASRIAFSELVTYVDPGEYSRMLTNPFAASKMLRDFTDVATQGGKYLWYNTADAVSGTDLTKKLYYTRGSYKGELKLKKELYDVAPLLKQANRWVSFDTVEDFYIRSN